MNEQTIHLDSTASTKNLNSDFEVEAVESGMGYVLLTSGRVLPILPVFCFDENGPNFVYLGFRECSIIAVEHLLTTIELLEYQVVIINASELRFISASMTTGVHCTLVHVSSPECCSYIDLRSMQDKATSLIVGIFFLP